jgi:hypothetical protein
MVSIRWHESNKPNWLQENNYWEIVGTNQHIYVDSATYLVQLTE